MLYRLVKRKTNGKRPFIASFLIKVLVVYVLVLGMIACSSLKHNEVVSIEFLARKAFGENTIIIYNENGLHALCYTQRKTDRLNPGNALDYGLMDLKTGKILFREQKYHATVRWMDNQTLIVESESGVQSMDNTENNQMAVYYIDVLTLQKRYTYP
jgi:hypothetical protein